MLIEQAIKSHPATAVFDLWVRCYRVLDMEGHTDMAQGHFTIRDAGGNGFWMKRTGISLGEVGNPEDFVLVGFDGRRLAGSGGVHGEWHIHAEIFKRRPEVNAIGHTHPFYACVFSASRQPLRPVAHEAASLPGPIPRYEGTSNLIDTPALGRELAEALGDASAVLMKNHGITFCGRSPEECVLTGIFLERACRAQLLISAAAGDDWDYTSREEAAEKYKTLMTPGYIRHCWEFYVRKLARTEQQAQSLREVRELLKQRSPA